MINFRFHIVSLTAVLLALGFGLVLGTTFLDDAVVKELRGRLDELDKDLDREEARNTELRGQLDTFEREAAGLNEQLGERLFKGQLEGVPVLVVAPQGLENDPVEGVLGALEQADADVAGVWWLTDRFVLDDGDEISELARALGIVTEDADRLRRGVAMQLANTLDGAADGSNGADEAPQSLVGDASAVPAEPDMLARLREAGFVEYELPEGVDGDAVMLPPSGLRTVIVSGPGAVLNAGDLVMPLLVDLASDGPVATVVAEPTPDPDSDTDQDADGAVEPTVVEIIRDDDDLAERVSTVDDLDRVAGRVATVLALGDAGADPPRVGHYGLMGDARLLPSPDEGG